MCHGSMYMDEKETRYNVISLAKRLLLYIITEIKNKTKRNIEKERGKPK